MQRDPDRKRTRIADISSMRLDEQARAEITAILGENPLYNRSVILRGALLVLFRLPKKEREAAILEAAAR